MVVFDLERGREFFNTEYPNVEKDTGRRFKLEDLTSTARAPASHCYIYRGVKRLISGWKVTRQKMDAFYQQGRLHFSPDKIELVTYMEETPSD